MSPIIMHTQSTGGLCFIFLMKADPVSQIASLQAEKALRFEGSTQSVAGVMG